MRVDPGAAARLGAARRARSRQPTTRLQAGVAWGGSGRHRPGRRCSSRSCCTHPAERQWPELALLGGIAAAVTVEVATGLSAQVKWPNDVMLDRHKVGGVLAEARDATVVLGIGLNVNQRRDELPLDATTKPASLRTTMGHDHDVAELLGSLLGRLERLYDGVAGRRPARRLHGARAAKLPLRPPRGRRRQRRHRGRDRARRPARGAPLRRRDAAHRERRGRARRRVTDLERLTIRFMEAVRDRELDWLEAHVGEEFTLTTGRTEAPVRGRDEWLRVPARLRDRGLHLRALEAFDTARSASSARATSQRGSMDGERATRRSSRPASGSSGTPVRSSSRVTSRRW